MHAKHVSNIIYTAVSAARLPTDHHSSATNNWKLASVRSVHYVTGTSSLNVALSVIQSFIHRRESESLWLIWQTIHSVKIYNIQTIHYRNCSCTDFSRSYCYTVWSAIGIIPSSVCPSVCLSVWNAVHYGSHDRCTGLKLVPACSCQASSYLSVQPPKFTKHTEKNEPKKPRTWVLLRQTIKRRELVVLWSNIHWLRELLSRSMVTLK